MDETFNEKRLIENMVEVNIFYKEYKERMELDVVYILLSKT